MKTLLKNKTYRKLTNFIVSLAALSWVDLPASSQSLPPLKPYKIYVSQILQHPALDETRRGIYDKLIDSGLIPDKDFIWAYENAHGNISLASQISQHAVGEKPDAIVTLGTTVTQTAIMAARGHDIPIIFASVTDPVAAKIVDSLERPGPRATGVSNLTPLVPQFTFFRELQPQLKTLGIIYNPGEANSCVLIEKMKQAGEKLGIKLILAAASRTSDVKSAAHKLRDDVDAFYVNNDNTALAAFPSIVKVGLGQNKPTYVSDTDIVEQGALAALGPNQYDLGHQVGELLIRVLKGEKVENIPVQFPTKKEQVINQKIAKKLGLNIKISG